MRISSMVLKNIKCFQEKEISFVSNATGEISNVCVLVGANGAGKTTILKSIVSTFSLIDPTFKGEIFNSRAITIGADNAVVQVNLNFGKQEVVDIGKMSGKSFSVFSCYHKNVSIVNNHQKNSTIFVPFINNSNISFSIGNQPVELAVTVDSTIPMMGEALDANGNVNDSLTNYSLYLWQLQQANKGLVIYIDAFRYAMGTTELSIDNNKNEVNAKDCALKSTIVNGKVSKRHASLRQWLLELDYKHLKNANDYHTKSIYSFLIKVCNTFFDEFVYEGIDENKQIKFRSKENKALLMDLDMLSDGFKSVFIIIAELIRRLSTAYKTDIENDIEFYEGEAVVLIDEIDCHLHPKWQQKILPGLRKLFPNCQFIVTTHSPFVLDSVNSDEIIKIGEKSIG